MLQSEEEKTNPIYKNKLILAEGKDDARFLFFLLQENDINDIQIRQYNGVDRLTSELKTLIAADGFDKVESLLIVRDCDNSTQSAIDSVNYSLRITGLMEKNIEPFTMNVQNNRNIGFVLFPGIDENDKLYEKGTLEHLCLNIFKESFHKDKVKTYLDDFQKYNSEFKRPHKNELHALFSFTDKFVGSKIGETARDGGFDFNSPYLQPFLEMIKKM